MKRIVTTEEVTNIFATAEHQAEAAEKLYRLAFPNWDEIESISGWPSAGEELNQEIFQHFIAFDRKHHPGVMPGGLWMNKGFSTLDKSLGPRELSTDNCEVETR